MSQENNKPEQKKEEQKTVFGQVELSQEDCNEVIQRAIAMSGAPSDSPASIWKAICEMRDLVTRLRMKRSGSANIAMNPRTVNPTEAVQHPQHYNQGKFEVIDVIEDWKLGFNDGNAIKYIGRHRMKGTPKQDLEKAFWYLTRELLKVHGVSVERLCESVLTCAKPSSPTMDEPIALAKWGTKREPGGDPKS